MRILLVLVLFLSQLRLFAQIKGSVVDSENGFSIPFVSVMYEGDNVGTTSSEEGIFSIKKLPSKKLMFSALGYRKHYIIITSNIDDSITIQLTPESYQLSEVVVTRGKTKYSRKNNPAIELIRKVISNRDKYYISRNANYQYDNYKKSIVLADDIDTDTYLAEKNKNGKSWFIDHVEYSDKDEKWILPLQIEETVSRVRTVNDVKEEDILGHQSTGFANFSETSSEFMNKVVGDIATEVDVCENTIRLFQQSFVSPISENGLRFYHYYIADTLNIDNEKCVSVYFCPANKQDFGFNGTLFVSLASHCQLKKSELSLPAASNVNFIRKIRAEQSYENVSDSIWSLITSKLYFELNVLNIADNAGISLTTKRTHFNFGNICLKSIIDKEAINAENRDISFWNKHRSVPLSAAEQSLDSFYNKTLNKKGVKFIAGVMRVLIDDYIGTFGAKKSKFEFGPLKSIASGNQVDGLRIHLGGRTTSSLHSRLFLEGYAAHGFKSEKWYYSGKMLYSFNKVYRQPWEYPIHQMSISAESDILSPAQIFLDSEKDNVFTSFTVKPLYNFLWYNMQVLDYKNEVNSKLLFHASLKLESITPAVIKDKEEGLSFQTSQGSIIDKIRTTELSLAMRYSSGEKYIVTKTGRYPINKDYSLFELKHSLGIRGILGGEYWSNMTEVSLSHRFQLGDFGYSDAYVKTSVQWNTVPYPLLIMPKTNLSWLSQHDSHTFLLMNDLEFITDREFVWDISWSPNGKILNRIPLIKKLKLREYFSFRGMCGHLSKKNNPNQSADRSIFLFPQSTAVIGHSPYMEIVVGLSNIFKFCEIDYVRRLSYLDNVKNANGVRFTFNFSF